jgi:hypothetical protein
MNELLRLDYLEAMGITQYVARMPLPGACPSPVIHIEVVATEHEQPASIAAMLDESFSAARKPSISTSRPATITNPAPQIESTSSTAPTAFQCQIAIWTVNDLLILADAPRLDNSQLTLLRNILQAIGRTDNLSDAKQFSWPLPQRKDKKLLAAQEHFQGLLDGGLLKTNGLRQILCFGDAVCALLHTDASTHEKNAPENNVLQYQDWPVTSVCALHEMLAQPTRKAETWRAIQVLIRA